MNNKLQKIIDKFNNENDRTSDEAKNLLNEYRNLSFEEKKRVCAVILNDDSINDITEKEAIILNI